MTQTRAGAKKALATLKAKFESEEAYMEWKEAAGRKGGEISRGGGFAADKKFASEMGRKGGKVSRKPRS